MKNYNINIKELNPCKLQLDFDIAQDEVVSETEKVYLNLQKNAKIQGFRTGKAPMDIIKAKYSPVAKEHVAENLMREVMSAALKEKNIVPITLPRVDKFEFEFNKPFKFSATLEKNPEITARDYKSLKLKKQIKAVTENDVQKSITELQKYNTRLVESKSDKVRKDDCAIATYQVFSADGDEIKELSAENQLIDLSSEQLLPGIVDGIINADKNEAREIKTKLPQDFPKKDIAGKDVTIKITINEIKEKVLPELNDNFAKDLGYQTFAELKTKVKESLEAKTEEQAKQKLEEEINEHLLKSNTITVPESLVEEQAQYLLSVLMEKGQRMGIAPEIIENQKSNNTEKCRNKAETQVKLLYILNAIAKQENITVTQDEINQKKEEIVNSNPNHRKEDLTQLIETQENMDRLISHIKSDKIYKFILDNAKITVKHV
ncbi:MAG: trigger factor [Elusimicrobia bacterium CG1_02_37_114]|nr:MAG: trigger factor [Elusimicrobia bacterium CG1_02_37_114]PIV52869.1 MAG: trigger factor [Elusimicrobia bacterium CG02_land_8_20_14_3_00_37_13]PIZ14167.1 MAG: trigger factor [Elusimicrobia bacterium CG_4_10_14_0_8_um_filter_37_32]